MERVVDKQRTDFFPVGTGEKQQPEAETWKKSIPAQVFLNHYLGMSYHIKQSVEAGQLQQVPYFLDFRANMEEADTEQIKKHLLNCWSTEYALRTTAATGDEQYLRNALHWTFPQAYYSIYAGIQAFLITQGIQTNNAERIRREIGRLVVKGAYPQAIAFYAAGHFKDFRVYRLPFAKWKPSLNLVDKEPDAQAHIGQFLKTTRRLRAYSVRQQVQNDPETAIRSQKTGETLKKFNANHWNQLTWRIGYTTYFDLMSRLRISASHREIERFLQADIDYKLFHKSLLDLVSYINFIHETYVAKALGLDEYKKLVAELPAYLQNSFVARRLRKYVAPVLLSIEPDDHAEETWNMSA